MKRDFNDLAHIGIIGFGGFTTARLAQLKDELQAWVLILTLLGLIAKAAFMLWKYFKSKCARCPHNGTGWTGCQTCHFKPTGAGFGDSALCCLLLLAAGLGSGCGAGKQHSLPTLPPSPSTVSTADAVARADTHAAAAQSAVATATLHARAGDAVNAVPPLDTAGTELTGTRDELAKAKSEVATLQRRIAAQDAAQRAQLDATIAEWRSKLDAAQAELKTQSSANKKLSGEIERLKNESLHRAKTILGVAGGVMGLGGIGLIVAALMGGFAPGLRWGPVFIAMGVASVAFATLLAKLVLIAQIAIGVGLAACLGWVGWQLYKHQNPIQTSVTGTANS